MAEVATEQDACMQRASWTGQSTECIINSHDLHATLTLQGVIAGRPLTSICKAKLAGEAGRQSGMCIRVQLAKWAFCLIFRVGKVVGKFTEEALGFRVGGPRGVVSPEWPRPVVTALPDSIAF